MDKRPALSVPQTREACAELIAQIGRLDDEMNCEEMALNDAVRALTEDSEKAMAAMRVKRSRLVETVQAYCEAHRSTLLSGRAKNFKFSTGKIGWKTEATTVAYKKEDIPVIIAALEHRKAHECVKVSKSIAKGPLKEFVTNNGAIPRVVLKGGHESFYVKPDSVALDGSPESAAA